MHRYARVRSSTVAASLSGPCAGTLCERPVRDHVLNVPVRVRVWALCGLCEWICSPVGLVCGPVGECVRGCLWEQTGGAHPVRSIALCALCAGSVSAVEYPVHPCAELFCTFLIFQYNTVSKIIYIGILSSLYIKEIPISASA